MAEGKGGRSDQALRTPVLTWQCPFPRADSRPCSATIQPRYPMRTAAYQRCCVLLKVLFLPLYLCAEEVDYSLPANAPKQTGPGGWSLHLLPKKDSAQNKTDSSVCTKMFLQGSAAVLPAAAAWLGTGHGLLAARSVLRLKITNPLPHPLSKLNMVFRSRRMFFNWTQKLCF